MAEISNLILSTVSKGSNVASAEPAEPSEDGSKVQKDAFSVLLAGQIAERRGGQSGKSLPQSGDKTATDNADESDLHSLQLKSGLKIIVGGEAPSAEAVSAFAESQGINPTAIELLLGESNQGEGLKQVGLSTDLRLTATTDVKGQLASLPNGLSVSEDDIKIDEAHVARQANSHQPQGDDLLAAWIANSGGADNAVANQSASSSVEVKPAFELLAQQQRMASQGLTTAFANAKDRVDTMVKQRSTNEGSIALSGKQLVEALQQAAQEGIRKESIPSAQVESGAKASGAAMADFAGKLLFKDSQLKNVVAQWQGRNKTAQTAIKLDAINLALPATPVTLGESAFLAAQQSSTEMLTKPMPDSLPEHAMQQAMRKHDEMLEMSRRLTEALGQRLAAQITRGAWRVEMDLHPKSLGRIEIQLEMKNGELEANFHSANSATRELLAESMPRLRTALEEHGMETAYIGLELANQGKSDGKSTAQQHQSQSDVLVDDEPESREIKGHLSDDGLDVLV
ncbi:MAG: flagellar hook-length control protein FliK [Porticoccaceae bacterium]|nr:flagellar hook-length control protein FliK [Porticoccaceae bacterium]